MRTHSNQNGFALLEALIAALILAIGLLGVAGLNLLGLRSSIDSSTRSAATILSYEIIDLIRANPSALNNYVSSSVIDTTTALPSCYTASCTPANQATFDRTAWARSIYDNSISDAVDRARQAKLPNGAAVICRDSTPNDGTSTAAACSGSATDPLVVKIWWDERAMNATEASSPGNTLNRQRFVMSFF